MNLSPLCHDPWVSERTIDLLQALPTETAADKQQPNWEDLLSVPGRVFYYSQVRNKKYKCINVPAGQIVKPKYAYLPEHNYIFMVCQNFCKTRPRLPSENEQKTPILAMFCIISPKQAWWRHNFFVSF